MHLGPLGGQSSGKSPFCISEAGAPNINIAEQVSNKMVRMMTSEYKNADSGSK